MLREKAETLPKKKKEKALAGTDMFILGYLPALVSHLKLLLSEVCEHYFAQPIDTQTTCWH